MLSKAAMNKHLPERFLLSISFSQSSVICVSAEHVALPSTLLNAWFWFIYNNLLAM
jgi:hypothetical protein